MAEKGLYSAPLVRSPTLGDLEELSDKFKLGLTGTPLLEEYQTIIGDMLKDINGLEEIVEPTLPVKYPRTPGYRPSREENKYNAWYWKSEIHGSDQGKLLGKRIAIKDTVAVAGVPMMTGCNILRGYVPDFDATVVTRLLDAGGIIVGKSVCEDLCFSGSSYTSGTGPVLNPVSPKHSAGGSSSGSGALVAAEEVDMAIGGDQGGSVRLPACWCGIVGLKPTFGLVPYTGAMSIDLTLDHLGPMTRTVKECALMLEAIAGYDDGNDPRQHPDIYVPEYSIQLDNYVPTGLRIGVLKEGFGFPQSDPKVDTIIKDFISQYGKNHPVTVIDVSVPLHRKCDVLYNTIQCESTTDTVIRTGGVGTNFKGFYPTSMMQSVGARLTEKAKNLDPLQKSFLLMGEYLRVNYNSHIYGKAQNLRKLMTKAYDDVLEECDVIVMPTIPFTATPLPTGELSVTEYFRAATDNASNVIAANLTGHPAITINVGDVDGLPVGLMLTARKFEEQLLLQVAHSMEKFKQ